MAAWAELGEATRAGGRRAHTRGTRRQWARASQPPCLPLPRPAWVSARRTAEAADGDRPHEQQRAREEVGEDGDRLELELTHKQVGR